MAADSPSAVIFCPYIKNSQVGTPVTDL